MPVQRRAYGADTCGEFREVGADLIGKTRLNEIDAEDGLVSQQAFEFCAVRFFAQLELLYIGLCRFQQRVGGRFESVSVIVHRHQVAQPAGMHQRDQLEILHIERGIGQIGLDRLAEADGEFLGSVRCDALGRIRHEGVA